MFRNKSRRGLAALGGAIMLAGAGTALAATPHFRAVLNGDNVTGGAADSDGWGRARIGIHQASHELCTDLEVRSIGRVTSAQIYRGRAAEHVVAIEHGPEMRGGGERCPGAGEHQNAP